VIRIAERNQNIDIQEASQLDSFVLAQLVDEFIGHDYSWPMRQQGYTTRRLFQLGCETLPYQIGHNFSHRLLSGGGNRPSGGKDVIVQVQRRSHAQSSSITHQMSTAAPEARYLAYRCLPKSTFGPGVFDHLRSSGTLL
jgi:hypothetical protein